MKKFVRMVIDLVLAVAFVSLVMHGLLGAELYNSVSFITEMTVVLTAALGCVVVIVAWFECSGTYDYLAKLFNKIQWILFPKYMEFVEETEKEDEV